MRNDGQRREKGEDFQKRRWVGLVGEWQQGRFRRFWARMWHRNTKELGGSTGGHQQVRAWKTKNQKVRITRSRLSTAGVEQIPKGVSVPVSATGPQVLKSSRPHQDWTRNWWERSARRSGAAKPRLAAQTYIISTASCFKSSFYWVVFVKNWLWAESLQFLLPVVFLKTFKNQPKSFRPIISSD